MKSVNIFLAWLLVFSIISSIKSDEPSVDQVRQAYDSYISKFKKPGSNFALTNVQHMWQSAETTEVLIDAYERFKDDATKKNMIEVVDSYLKREGEDFKWNKYNDDIMWACIMLTRAYLNTNNDRYLTVAKNNFNAVYERAWTNEFEGGLLWYQDKTEKNACVNGPAAVAACLLAIATKDNSYYDKADALVTWLNKKLVQEDGSVWDKIDKENNNLIYNKWVSTYNQGTYIGATSLLYEHNHKAEYLEMAKKAAKRATKIQNILDGEDSGPDLIGFKGVLARWLGKLIKDLKINEFKDWATKNAQSAWANRNKDNLMWTKFGTKTQDNIENSNDKREWCAWGCSSALSWLINLGAI